MPDVQLRYFNSFDGSLLAWREMGAGRAVVLLHGLFSNAETNWMKYGHAEAIADKGFRVIMPDLRGHGDSAKPHEAAAYPPDVLVDDAFATIAHLGLTDYDLGGYSLGARTVARMLVRGATPRRAVLSGMGLAGLTNFQARTAHFKHILDNPGTFERFSPEWNAEAFLKTTRGDRQALRLLLDAMTGTTIAELEAIETPVLVLTGREDSDNGSAADLAAVLPNATLVETHGGHMSAVTKPDLGAALVKFLVAN